MKQYRAKNKKLRPDVSKAPCLCGESKICAKGKCGKCYHAEYWPKYAAENKEHIAKARKQYWQDYCAANADRRKQRFKKWQADNKEYRNTYNKAITHTRRARLNGRYSAAEWEALLERFNHTCPCCGGTGVKLTVDHIVPVSRGGSNYIENVQPLCNCCRVTRRRVLRLLLTQSEIL